MMYDMGMSTHRATSLVKEKFPKATHAVARFSGGNDEGGVEEIKVIYKDGEGEGAVREVLGEINPNFSYGESVYVYDNGVLQRNEDGTPKMRSVTKEEREEGQIFEALSEPVNSEYGSFAGDFYVSGKVVWDLKTGRYQMSGNTEVPMGNDWGPDLSDF